MGWDNASTIAGDVQDARRTYTRAMSISLLLVVLTYVVPILAVAHARHSILRLGNRILGDICRAFRRGESLRCS